MLRSPPCDPSPEAPSPACRGSWNPSQRRHRIAHRRGLEQSLQVLQKRRVPRRQPRAPPALATHLPGQRAGVPQVLQTASDRASGDLRRTRGRRDPALAGRLRLGGGAQPSASLVKRGTKRFKSDTQRRFIYHRHDIDADLEDRNPPNSQCRQNPKPDSPVSGRRLSLNPSARRQACRAVASAALTRAGVVIAVEEGALLGDQERGPGTLILELDGGQ